MPRTRSEILFCMRASACMLRAVEHDKNAHKYQAQMLDEAADELAQDNASLTDLDAQLANVQAALS